MSSKLQIKTPSFYIEATTLDRVLHARKLPCALASNAAAGREKLADHVICKGFVAFCSTSWQISPRRSFGARALTLQFGRKARLPCTRNARQRENT